MPPSEQARGSVRVSSWGSIDLRTDGSPLALSFGCTVAEAPWSVGTEPEKVDGIVNGSVSLVCDIRSHPAAEIAWYKDGRALRLGEEATVTRGVLGRARMIVCAPALDSSRSPNAPFWMPPVGLELSLWVVRHTNVTLLSDQQGCILQKSMLLLPGSSVPSPVGLSKPLHLKDETSMARLLLHGAWLGAGASVILLALLQAVLIPCSPFLPGSRVLQLPHLQHSSSGTYTCMALNVASQDEKSFILTIHGEC